MSCCLRPLPTKFKTSCLKCGITFRSTGRQDGSRVSPPGHSPVVTGSFYLRAFGYQRQSAFSPRSSSYRNSCAAPGFTASFRIGLTALAVLYTHRTTTTYMGRALLGVSVTYEGCGKQWHKFRRTADQPSVHSLANWTPVRIALLWNIAFSSSSKSFISSTAASIAC